MIKRKIKKTITARHETLYVYLLRPGEKEKERDRKGVNNTLPAVEKNK